MKFTKILVATLIAVAAVIAPVVSAPAMADAACNPNEAWRGPTVITNPLASGKVLAISSPWGLGSRAYIWTNNHDPRQQWYWDCTSGGSNDNTFLLRYANNSNLCLQWSDNDGGVAVLANCSGAFHQQFLRIYDSVGTAFQLSDPALAIVCLDLTGGSSVNGTFIQSWDCIGNQNQRWRIG